MRKTLFFAALFLFFSTFQTAIFAQNIEEGAKLFKANCAACHKVDVQEAMLVGPGLLKVRERWAGKDALLNLWIKEPRKALATGDPYIKALWDKYPSEMPGQAVSDEEIGHILAYLDNPPSKVAPAQNTVKNENVAESTSTDLPLVLMVFGALLLLLIGIVHSMKKQLNLLLEEKAGTKKTILTCCQWMEKNKKPLAYLGVFIHLLGGGLLFLALNQINVTPGYHPSQPIAFSHNVHASIDNAGIECLYCHSSADKSKHAGIPAVEVCMNCHKGIQEGRNTGTAEIQKIYDAINFNPKTGQYGKEEDKKPIVWNKVHNLPDHVYFNHSQHVVMGKIECQTCHGKVEEMTTAAQYAPLTMAWCIDCHRNNEVPGFSDQNNAYYQELHQRMDKKLLREILENKATPQKLGGIECAKCHY